MFSKNLSARPLELTILSVVVLMYIALCAEADMYVPAFPEMVKFFSTTEDKIQLILSINFAGLCIASLISGPLSDTFGRRNVLMSGLILFFVSSLGCVFAESFTTMLIWRFIQGMSASVPMVIGCTLFLDKYPLEKASQLVGICNSVITAAMAGAPILGTWISSTFHWRGNFILITTLVGLCLIGTFLFIDESLPVQNRKKFQAFSIAKDYFTDCVPNLGMCDGTIPVNPQHPRFRHKFATSDSVRIALGRPRQSFMLASSPESLLIWLYAV
jgi:DHA1 family bicyclomycin/chloramphenicol resistance-like MFS transporter